jgi:uncharacterized iron-regulated membrane protein
MSLTGDLVHHPRRLWLRKAFFQVHLWSGVLFAVYLLLIAVSGSVLVYKDELTRWTLPRDLHPYRETEVAAPETAMDRFAQAEPGGNISLLQVPSPVLPVYLLEGKDGHGRAGRWIGDPTTAALTPAPRTWIDTMLDLHNYLLLPHSWGMQANAAGAATLLLLAITGAFLWWPGVRTWSRGLRINVRANWRRINYDLHSAIGFWTLGIVAWWAVSGVYFGFYRQVSEVVGWFSPVRGMQAPEPASLPLVIAKNRVPLDQVLDAARAVSPQGRLWSISDPSFQTTESYVLLDRGAPGDFSHRDIVRVRTTDAHVISVWQYGQRHTFGDWVLWSMHPLHFGTVWGPAVKLLWFLLGMSLAVLTVTGLLMYWNRFLRKVWQSSRWSRPIKSS